LVLLQVVKGEDFPPMNDLLRLYKKAFLDGNDDVVSDIEKAIAGLEEERSKAASQFESITAEIISGKNKFLRLNADLENFRKQTEKDRAKFTSSIQVDLVQSLLPLVDSFEKANVEVTLETDKEQKISTSYQGIYKQLVETLKSLGVGVVETVGKPFDPLVSTVFFFSITHFTSFIGATYLASINTCILMLLYVRFGRSLMLCK
jgi:molecular chaperone GrpE (heat shock protein)